MNKQQLCSLAVLIFIVIGGFYYYNNSLSYPTSDNAVSAQPTPVPIPEAVPANKGESGLYTLSFTHSDDLKSPLVSIRLRSERTAEIKRISPTRYQMTIPSAHASAPIFLLPQIAPDGFEPFAKVTLSELTDVNEPNHIVATIELTREAEIRLRRNGNDFELYEVNKP
jgi:hypothetical protein